MFLVWTAHSLCSKNIHYNAITLPKWATPIRDDRDLGHWSWCPMDTNCQLVSQLILIVLLLCFISDKTAFTFLPLGIEDWLFLIHFQFKGTNALGEKMLEAGIRLLTRQLDRKHEEETEASDASSKVNVVTLWSVFIAQSRLVSDTSIQVISLNWRFKTSVFYCIY